MKSYSNDPQPQFVASGQELRINFDHATVEVTDPEGALETQHVCEQVITPARPKRREIIEAVMAARYPTYGAEIAAMRNGGAEADEHDAWREKAKAIADAWQAQ